jgi:hypothetical protein
LRLLRWVLATLCGAGTLELGGAAGRSLLVAALCWRHVDLLRCVLLLRPQHAGIQQRRCLCAAARDPHSVFSIYQVLLPGYLLCKNFWLPALV